MEQMDKALKLKESTCTAESGLTDITNDPFCTYFQSNERLTFLSKYIDMTTCMEDKPELPTYTLERVTGVGHIKYLTFSKHLSVISLSRLSALTSRL